MKNSSIVIGATGMGASNKRAFPRITAPAGSYVSFAEGVGLIRNLSVGGALIEDPHPLTDGTTVNLTLHLNGESMACRGVVRRSIPDRGMGVQFVELTSEERRRLGSYLLSLYRDENRKRLES